MLQSRFVSNSSSYHTISLKDDIVVQQSHPFRDGEDGVQRQTPRVIWQDIAWNTFFLTFPMLFLTCVLFTFIFTYRITSIDPPFQQLQVSNESSRLTDTAYFVDLNSTFLIFIASWMSSLAPMLAGFAIALAAYPVAGRLYDDTMRKQYDRLLTPFQFHLTLRLVTGSTWSTLWNLLLYRLGRKKPAMRQGVALTSLATVTCTMIFLGTMVFGADTWLHITTKTVSISRLSLLDNQAVPYSLSLIPNCTVTNNTLYSLSAAGLECTMDPNTSLLTSGTTVLQTLNNQSNVISVLNDGPDPSLAYLTITPFERAEQTDFSASTFGLRTTCRPITSTCNMTTDGTFLAFNCSDGNFATTTSQKLRYDWGIFQDEAMTQQIFGGVSENPFYYVGADLISSFSRPIHNLTGDPGILLNSTNVGVIVLCSMEVFDIEYDVVEGKVVEMIASRSNSSVANVIQPALDQADYGTPNIQNAFNMAAAEATSAQDLADMFSLSFSKIALSVAAGSVTATPVLAAQFRNSILVARIYKAPLFLLVACNLAFVMMGLLLAINAARSSPEAREVQARLSIAGIVAYMFDEKTAKAVGMQQSIAGQPERLYAEHYEGSSMTKVGLGRGDVGGFEFRSIRPDAKDIGIEVWSAADEKLSQQDEGDRPGWI